MRSADPSSGSAASPKHSAAAGILLHSFHHFADQVTVDVDFLFAFSSRSISCGLAPKCHTRTGHNTAMTNVPVTIKTPSSNHKAQDQSSGPRVGSVFSSPGRRRMRLAGQQRSRC
jgi:hypothetical protein